MYYQHHDILPVLGFFCSLPDAGPGDTHASGPERAKNIAHTYGYRDKADPCVSDAELNATLQAAIRKMAVASSRHFSNVKGSVLDDGRYRSSVSITFHGSTSSCAFSEDSLIGTHCDYLYLSRPASETDSKYQELIDAVDAALPAWIGKEESSMKGFSGHPREVHTWVPNVQTSEPRVEVRLKTDPDDHDFVVLSFVATDSN